MTLPRRILLTLSLILPATTAHAQDYVGQVWNQLRETETENEEYSPHHYLIATLGGDDTYGFTTDLDPNSEYIVVAACDQDCTDVDLWIRDAAGNVIASDTADDDYPIVRFTPPRSGKYRIDVKMVSCAEDYCYFGLGVFEYP